MFDLGVFANKLNMGSFARREQKFYLFIAVAILF
jgi:hypothetical protein